MREHAAEQFGGYIVIVEHTGPDTERGDRNRLGELCRGPHRLRLAAEQRPTTPRRPSAACRCASIRTAHGRAARRAASGVSGSIAYPSSVGSTEISSTDASSPSPQSGTPTPAANWASDSFSRRPGSWRPRSATTASSSRIVRCAGEDTAGTSANSPGSRAQESGRTLTTVGIGRRRHPPDLSTDGVTSSRSLPAIASLPTDASRADQRRLPRFLRPREHDDPTFVRERRSVELDTRPVGERAGGDELAHHTHHRGTRAWSEIVSHHSDHVGLDSVARPVLRIRDDHRSVDQAGRVLDHFAIEREARTPAEFGRQGPAQATAAASEVTTTVGSSTAGRTRSSPGPRNSSSQSRSCESSAYTATRAARKRIRDAVLRASVVVAFARRHEAPSSRGQSPLIV